MIKKKRDYINLIDLSNNPCPPSNLLNYFLRTFSRETENVKVLEIIEQLSWDSFRILQNFRRLICNNGGFFDLVNNR